MFHILFLEMQSKFSKDNHLSLLVIVRNRTTAKLYNIMYILVIEIFLYFKVNKISDSNFLKLTYKKLQTNMF